MIKSFRNCKSLIKNAAPPVPIIKNQNKIIVNQTKHPAKNLINTVNNILTTKANPTQIPSNGHPCFKSEKYFCNVEISAKWLKSNLLSIY